MPDDKNLPSSLSKLPNIIPISKGIRVEIIGIISTFYGDMNPKATIGITGEANKDTNPKESLSILSPKSPIKAKNKVGFKESKATIKATELIPKIPSIPKTLKNNIPIVVAKIVLNSKRLPYL